MSFKRNKRIKRRLQKKFGKVLGRQIFLNKLGNPDAPIGEVILMTKSIPTAPVTFFGYDGDYSDFCG